MSRYPKLYDGIPADYPLCLKADCPKADTCLHQLAFRRHEELGTYLSLINPSVCTGQNDCPRYVCNEPVKLAKGFTVPSMSLRHSYQQYIT